MCQSMARLLRGIYPFTDSRLCRDTSLLGTERMLCAQLAQTYRYAGNVCAQFERVFGGTEIPMADRRAG